MPRIGTVSTRQAAALHGVRLPEPRRVGKPRDPDGAISRRALARCVSPIALSG